MLHPFFSRLVVTTHQASNTDFQEQSRHTPRQTLRAGGAVTNTASLWDVRRARQEAVTAQWLSAVIKHFTVNNQMGI